VTDLFWLTTLIPGFALLLVLSPHDLNRGFLATLTLSYVLTVALMAPIVVLAFAVHFSVQTVAACYLVLVLGGVVVAIRAGGLPRLGRLLRSTHWFEVGLVLVAIALTFPLGASAQSDSFAHSAKIRYMRDVGFYLQDAYSPLAVIETKWHVNVHHAYFAIASWVGGIEPLDLWFRAAWFFRLLAVGAIGFLGATVFRSRWIAAVAMVGALAVLGTKLTIVFPFSVTAFVVTPILLALVVDVLERPSRSRYVKVVLCSLSLAVLHIGTWFLAALCIGPVVVAWTIWRRGLRESWRHLALAAVTLVTGVPFLLVSALQPNYVVEQQDLLHLRMVRTVQLTDSWSITIIDPTHYAWMLPMLAALALLAVVARPLRARVLMLSGIMLGAMVFMFTPGVFDLLTRLIPYWLVHRFRNFGEVIGLVMVAGGVAWVARPMLRTRLAHRVMTVLVLCGSLAAFRANIQGYVLDSRSQRRWLQEAHKLQEAVGSSLTPHALVAGDPAWSLVLPAVHLSRVMAADLHHANPADGGLLERFADTQELLAAETTDDRRRQIIAKHGIDFILIREAGAKVPPPRFDAVGDVVAARNGFVVYRIKT
jgi:hypothetical protein